jgi:hypothetical protein
MTLMNFVPTGTILPTGESTIPAGWLLCDGSAVSRTIYADLFGMIGTNWGNGDGTTTFHLPDLRGRFLRGRDGGIGRDPDRSTRVAANPGGNAGDNVGSIEDHAYKTHNHGVSVAGGTTGGESNGHIHGSGWVSHDHGHYMPAQGNHSHWHNDAYFAEAGAGNQGIRGEGYGSDWDNRPHYRWITWNWAGWHGHSMDGRNTDHRHWVGGRDAGHTHGVTSSVSVTNSGGNETRPKNIILHYMIKV